MWRVGPWQTIECKVRQKKSDDPTPTSPNSPRRGELGEWEKANVKSSLRLHFTFAFSPAQLSTCGGLGLGDDFSPLYIRFSVHSSPMADDLWRVGTFFSIVSLGRKTSSIVSLGSRSSAIWPIAAIFCHARPHGPVRHAFEARVPGDFGRSVLEKVM